MRIAVDGFQHETNTCAPVKATLADFQATDAWPGLVRGPAKLAKQAFDDPPMGGNPLPLQPEHFAQLYRISIRGTFA
jgi:microcystin degradation protein MlrC